MNKQPTSRMCFVCGEHNPAGIHVRFYEQEDGALLAKFIGEEHHQGYPGRMHGGVITAVLDETIGRAIMIKYGDVIWGVTAELSVRFLRPVPLDTPLTAVGRITNDRSRLFEGEGKIYLPDGAVAAECTGKYVKLDITQIADFDHEREEWYVRPD
ncbi:MAG: Thioesterase superfamily protein [Chloroflexi bacterium ADurb.Bin325]|nr:MAG: Thioesterase superfamily protein [Chloroflexi bacterium ADurb.Bin325]